MSHAFWLYAFDPEHLDVLVDLYRVASLDPAHVHELALPLDAPREVRVGDRVAVWVRPAPGSVYRSGLWALGIVDRQPDGGALYQDRDWTDRRRRRPFMTVRVRCADIVDGHHFDRVGGEGWWAETQDLAQPMCPVGLEDDALHDFRAVCEAAGLRRIIAALFPKAAAVWGELPEPNVSGLKGRRLVWIAQALSLPVAVVAAMRRLRGQCLPAADIEKSLGVPSGTLEHLAAREQDAARRFPAPGKRAAGPAAKRVASKPQRPSPPAPAVATPTAPTPTAPGPRPSPPAVGRPPIRRAGSPVRPAAKPSRSQPGAGRRTRGVTVCNACGWRPHAANGRCGCL